MAMHILNEDVYVLHESVYMASMRSFPNASMPTVVLGTRRYPTHVFP